MKAKWVVIIAGFLLTVTPVICGQDTGSSDKKSVGTEMKDATKTAAKDTEKGAKTATKDTEKAAVKTGHATKTAAKHTVKGTKVAAKGTEKGAKTAAKDTEKVADKTGHRECREKDWQRPQKGREGDRPGSEERHGENRGCGEVGERSVDGRAWGQCPVAIGSRRLLVSCHASRSPAMISSTRSTNMAFLSCACA